MEERDMNIPALIFCFLVILFPCVSQGQNLDKAIDYYNEGEYAKAALAFETALPALKKKYGKNDTAWYAPCITYTAVCFEKCQQLTKAEQYYVQAKNIFENISGVADPFYGIILNNLAELYRQTGQYEKALPLYLEAMEITEKALDKEHPDYATLLNNLADLYTHMGQYDKALPLYLEALEITEKALGKEHPDYGTYLNNLANLYRHMGQYEKTLPLYLEALENTEKALGKEHRQYATLLNNLAYLYNDMGQYEKALPLFLEAMEITEKALGKEHPERGMSLKNLADLYTNMGQYDKALPLYLEALEITEKALGKEHTSYGTILNNLADLYTNMGQYDKALPLYLEALEMTEKALGKEHPGRGMSLKNLADLYTTMGQYDKALPLYLEALEITEKALGKEHTSYGTILNNLANLYRQTGQYNKAGPLYLEALEITEKALGKEHPDYSIRLGNLANLYTNMGRYDKALPLYLEAMENTEKALGKEHPDYSISIGNLANLYRQTGQYEKALPLFLEALQNTEKALGKEHPSYGMGLNNLAALYWNIGQYDKALPLILEAKNNAFLNINRNFAFMSENAKEEYLKTLSFNFEIYQSFFMQYSREKPELASHAYNLELATKGMILQAGIQMRQSIAKSNNPEALAKYEEWMMYRNLMAREYAKAIKERRSDLKELESKAESLEAELNNISSAFGAILNIGKTDYSLVQKKLKKNEVAIEFASFNFYNGKTWTDSIMYVALLLLPGEEQARLVPLCEQKQLDSLLTKGSDMLAINTLYRGLVLLSDQNCEQGRPLYKLLWQAFEHLIPEKATVYYAPSGTLHQIAFAAMAVDTNALLSDKYRLVQVSTTAVLAQESKIGMEQPQSIALFGGIDYDADEKELLALAENISGDFVSRSVPADLNRGNTAWNFLPGTLSEVENIASMAKKNKVYHKIFTAQYAVEEQLKNLSGEESPHIVHIATHGFFFPDPKKDYSAFRFQTEEKQSVYRASDNPLHRAGLLFAGCNHAWLSKSTSENKDDGILTAYEITNVYLPKTRLVVLSACETGLGDIKGSEGVFGLQRAFKNAGVEYIIMSLWKIPDKETAEFMEYFYENLFGGSSIPEAFASTQKYMRRKYPAEPYKWAAFVMLK
jgi:tetratricopeptide (TPR) repeat protein/CHAT domain-containing protein